MERPREKKRKSLLLSGFPLLLYADVKRKQCELIKLYARDNQHLMELLNDKVQHIPGVTATETLISLDESINREIPIQADDNAE